jgi:hypothetical protein
MDIMGEKKLFGLTIRLWLGTRLAVWLRLGLTSDFLEEKKQFWK